jgi:acyl-[acyl-carrier-protein]-phospholipid O-acyltransferase/long-chain-fatty-acid--[acyl-carrier-protein] ligase
VGWYDTGDWVAIDADGFVTIFGRVKRFVKIAGEMISLETVEALARAASPYGEHAAINLPDAVRGEQIVLFTTDADLTRATRVMVGKRLGLPELAVPRRLEKVATIALLCTGKIDYQTLKLIAQEAV